MATGTLVLVVAQPNQAAGQAVRLTATVKDASAVAVNPATLTGIVTDPDGTTTSLAIGSWVNDTTGTFHVDYVTALAGRHAVSVVATVPSAADEASFVVEAAPASLSQWVPTSADVAALLAQRTIDATGLPTGAFSATSRPTSDQVDVFIADIAGEIGAACGPIPAQLYSDAGLVATLGASWLVELSFDDGTSSLASLLAARYELGLKRLANAVAQVNDTGNVEPGDDTPSKAVSVALYSDATYGYDYVVPGWWPW